MFLDDEHEKIFYDPVIKQEFYSFIAEKDQDHLHVFLLLVLL